MCAIAFFVRIEVTYVKELKKIKQIMNKLTDENLNQWKAFLSDLQ